MLVISDENFIDVDNTYAPENHYIELADGSRTLSAAKKRGTVLVNIPDEDDIVRAATLLNWIKLNTFIFPNTPAYNKHVRLYNPYITTKINIKYYRKISFTVVIIQNSPYAKGGGMGPRQSQGTTQPRPTRFQLRV